MMIPTEKMYMKHKKYMLKEACRNDGLSDEGLKIDLVRRWTKHQEKLFSKTWRGIVESEVS